MLHSFFQGRSGTSRKSYKHFTYSRFTVVISDSHYPNKTQEKSHEMNQKMKITRHGQKGGGDIAPTGHRGNVCLTLVSPLVLVSFKQGYFMYTECFSLSTSSHLGCLMKGKEIKEIVKQYFNP